MTHRTSPTMTTRRVEWADVTLGEHDALAILRHPDTVALLNAYWDAAWNDPANVWRAETPTRLSESGVQWLTDLRLAAHGDDARTAQNIARDFLRSMGTMLAVNVARSMRGAR